jgi:hypothetical protein
MFDSGVCPDMMVHPLDPEYDVAKIIDRIFAARDLQKSLQIIAGHAKVWERVVGTRGFTGKRAVNSHSQYNTLFDVVEEEISVDELDEDQLSSLENSIK